MLRALVLMLTFVTTATLLVAPPVLAQGRNADLSELWREYPLDPRQETPRPAGARERDAFASGPPPEPAHPPGPIVLAFLYVALALGALGVAGAARAIPKLRLVRGDVPSPREDLADLNGDVGLPSDRDGEEVTTNGRER